MLWNPRGFHKSRNDAPPNLDRLNCKSKGENNGRIRSSSMFSSLQHFGVRELCWNSRMGIRSSDKEVNYSHCTNQTTSWLMRSWSTFGARTSHEQTRTHKIHNDLDLGEATTFPLIVFFVFGHESCTQISFCPKTPKLGVPKFLKLGFSLLWRPITSCTNLRLRWGFKQSSNTRWDLSNDVCHVTYTQANQGDSWLLVVGSQIGNLIPIFSFGYNLCFKYSNGSCEHILDI
jgi:hypothetical protein